MKEESGERQRERKEAWTMGLSALRNRPLIRLSYRADCLDAHTLFVCLTSRVYRYAYTHAIIVAAALGRLQSAVQRGRHRAAIAKEAHACTRSHAADEQCRHDARAVSGTIPAAAIANEHGIWTGTACGADGCIAHGRTSQPAAAAAATAVAARRPDWRFHARCLCTWRHAIANAPSAATSAAAATITRHQAIGAPAAIIRPAPPRPRCVALPHRVTSRHVNMRAMMDMRMRRQLFVAIMSLDSFCMHKSPIFKKQMPLDAFLLVLI